MKAEDVGLDPALAFRSVPSDSRFLSSVLKDFNVTSKDSIIDIGCGKGSAMRTMLDFPFARVNGIELSADIANIARRNFLVLNEKRVTVFTGDATMYTDYGAYSFAFLFNPFPDIVMSRVIDSIISSIQKCQREFCIIYNNPAFHDAIIEKGVFTRFGSYSDKKGNILSVYSNYSGRMSRLYANKGMQTDGV
ncbi:MAG: class I SAM-dependent methyltransferase [Chlorobiaceae bacterium]|nr:class I SAM-dependent methyltransferase [Chlorobiaceae bacterium]